MNPATLNVLRCPYCSGTLNASAGDHVKGELEYGFLSCFCERYPVVAGIPILKKYSIRPATRLTAGQLIDLIEAGRHREALLAMLMLPPPGAWVFSPSWIQHLPSFWGMRKLKLVLGRPQLRRWKEEGEALFTAPRDKTVMELLEFYFRYQGEYGSGMYKNYSLRMGQPRQLVAVALASIVDQPTGPILDLACGFGHVTRHLMRLAKGQLVFGADTNFFAIWIAKNWLAPEAEYICADADTSVPLADRSCSLSYCSDAFWLFKNQASCIRELKRVTGGNGIIILTGLRNGLVKRDLPYDFPSLPPEGYKTLVADMHHRLVDHRAILDRYLKKQGAPLACQTEIGQLASVQWIALVASSRGELFYDYPGFTDWPHTQDGKLGLNPLYREEVKNHSDNVVLRRIYPSAWYEQENASHDPQYLPEVVSVSSKEIAALAQKKRTPEIDTLIHQGVVVANPERYFAQVPSRVGSR